MLAAVVGCCFYSMPLITIGHGTTYYINAYPCGEADRESSVRLYAYAGVWEFISSKQAIEIVADCETPEYACRAVSLQLHVMQLAIWLSAAAAAAAAVTAAVAAPAC